MSIDSVRNMRLISLFLLAYLLMSYPLLSLFNYPTFVWGVPLLYGYIFGVWILLIVVVAFVVGSRRPCP